MNRRGSWLACLLLAAGSALAAESRAPVPILAAEPYPNQDRVMRAAVQKYPELIGETRSGTYSLAVVLRDNGTIYDSKLGFLTESRIENSIMPIAGMRDVFRGASGNGLKVFYIGQTLVDAHRAADEIQVTWAILPEGYDESRAAGRVYEAVQTGYSHLMLPTMDVQDPDKVYTDANLMTIFLTEDGLVARNVVETTTIATLQAMSLRPSAATSVIGRVLVPPHVPVDAFEVLGLDAEQIGQTGMIVVMPRTGQSGGQQLRQAEVLDSMRAFIDTMRYQPVVAVRYAWPRRPGEPVGGHPQPSPAP